MNVHHLETKIEKRWLTRKELAEEWRISLSTLDGLLKDGLPSETWGRHIRRFNLAECERWRKRRAA